MSTLLEIKQGVANLLNIAIGDLTQNDQDLFLLASNQVRKQAELQNDFEFSRKTLRVTVNGLTGGDLALAVDANSTTYEVKTVIEVGLLDSTGNLCPVEWTTTSESLTRQREDNRTSWPRYPTDDVVQCYPLGGMRFTFSGNQISKWPLITSDTTDYPIYLEGYTFGTEWTASDLLTTGLHLVHTDFSPNFNITGTIYPIGVVGSSTVKTYAGQCSQDTVFLAFANSNTWKMLGGDGSIYFTKADGTGLAPTGSYVCQASAGSLAVTATGATSDIWTTHGSKYLLWATCVQLNHIWRRWVARQEGNLPPPSALAEEGLQALIAWDTYRFEAFRTHNR